MNYVHNANLSIWYIISLSQKCTNVLSNTWSAQQFSELLRLCFPDCSLQSGSNKILFSLILNISWIFFFFVNGSYMETMDKLISLLGWSFHDVYVSKDQVVHFKHIQCLYVSHTSAKLLKKKTTVSPLYTNLQVADFQRCQCAFSPCVWHTLSRACILYKWLGFCVSYCTVLYKVQ